MAKFSAQYYRTDKGEKKINCYHINISRCVVENSGIKSTDELKIYSKGSKIIIEKKG